MLSNVSWFGVHKKLVEWDVWELTANPTVI